MNAKNFQEYLASTGRANSGLSAQARMQQGNNLNTSINSLNAGEAAALADINRRTSLAHDTYNTGLAGANAQIEADYIQNLLNERDKELNRQLQKQAADLQERQFRESVRQFNENLALQKQQLQSRFSSGSGGGRTSYTKPSPEQTYKKTQDTVSVGVGMAKGGPTRMVGGMGVIDTPVYTLNGKKYYEDANGNMVEIKTKK